MAKILDQYGNPIERSRLGEPQTSKVGGLHREFAGHPARGLTPPKLAAILEAAEQGDLAAQCDLFDDMEERDGHILAEMSKRKRSLLTLDWDVAPPRNASAAEENDAAYARELLQDLPDFEDLMLDLLDAIGKGFSCVEMEWRLDGREWRPDTLHHRPQRWFQLDQGTRTELRLRDNTLDGAPLQPFGWIVHVHKARTGYLSRAGLHRCLAWPYLFKHYSVMDLAEFLEIYGLPLRLGTYQNGASEQEKATLMRAVTSIGHAAAGIIPEGMAIDFKESAQGASDPYMAMVDWCERTQSKAIVGQVLSAEAKPTGLGSGVASLQGDVRWDLTVSDARQLAGTLTRDLIYPLLALNRASVNPRRCPRFVFDTAEAEDLGAYADAIPKLVSIGARIPVSWMHERLRIPQAENDEPVLGVAAQPEEQTDQAALAALTGLARGANLFDQAAIDDADLGDQLQVISEAMLRPLIDEVRGGIAPEALLERLADLYPSMDDQALTDLLARVIFVADIWGRVTAQADG